MADIYFCGPRKQQLHENCFPFPYRRFPLPITLPLHTKVSGIPTSLWKILGAQKQPQHRNHFLSNSGTWTSFYGKEEAPVDWGLLTIKHVCQEKAFVDINSRGPPWRLGLVCPTTQCSPSQFPPPFSLARWIFKKKKKSPAKIPWFVCLIARPRKWHFKRVREPAGKNVEASKWKLVLCIHSNKATLYLPTTVHFSFSM